MKIHERVGTAFFQNGENLINRIDRQPLSRNVTCLWDGHDGVWNIIKQIGTSQQRTEVLDWYHRNGKPTQSGGKY